MNTCDWLCSIVSWISTVWVRDMEAKYKDCIPLLNTRSLFKPYSVIIDHLHKFITQFEANEAFSEKIEFVEVIEWTVVDELMEMESLYARNQWMLSEHHKIIHGLIVKLSNQNHNKLILFFLNIVCLQL